MAVTLRGVKSAGGAICSWYRRPDSQSLQLPGVVKGMNQMELPPAGGAEAAKHGVVTKGRGRSEPPFASGYSGVHDSKVFKRQPKQVG